MWRKLSGVLRCFKVFAVWLLPTTWPITFTISHIHTMRPVKTSVIVTTLEGLVSRFRNRWRASMRWGAVCLPRMQLVSLINSFNKMVMFMDSRVAIRVSQCLIIIEAKRACQRIVSAHTSSSKAVLVKIPGG